VGAAVLLLLLLLDEDRTVVAVEDDACVEDEDEEEEPLNTPAIPSAPSTATMASKTRATIRPVYLLFGFVMLLLLLPGAATIAENFTG
jgi:hypothetical protein